MKRKRNVVLIAIIVVFGLICLGACGFLIYKTVSEKQTQDMYESIAASYAPEPVSGTEDYTEPSYSLPVETVPETTKKKVESKANIVQLSSDNPDIYAWIYIPDTNVNYPVVQSPTEDNFYLDHDIYKNYSFPGAIYTQSCNKKDWTDRVTLLYGHNMRNGSMFATLHYFEDKDFFDSHPYIYIYTDNRRLTYEIVTAFDYDSRHIMNSYDFTKDDVFQKWLYQAKNPRSVSANVRSSTPLSLDSKMIVLSTCLNGGDGRYLVQGVLINDEPTI